MIGGGYTGLNAALTLAEAGRNVVLLESERIGWGASGRNGGQLGAGQRRDQDELERWLGPDHARRLWDLAVAANGYVRGRIERHRIGCELADGVIYAAHKPAYARRAAWYADKLRRDYGYEQRHALSRNELRELLGTDVYYGGDIDLAAGHLHPLKYALGLAAACEAAGVRIHEQSRVLGYDRGAPSEVRSARGTVRADHVVLGCNGYLGRLEGRVAGRIMPINNYMLATEPLGATGAASLIRDNRAVADSRFVVNYFRLSPDHRLLFGGGETYSKRFPADLGGFVRRAMLKVYPQLEDVRIDYAWGGTLAITRNRMPHVGRLEPNLYYAQGFSGHGVAMASFAGHLIGEAMASNSERFDVFARVPTPRFPGGTLLRWPGLVLGMLYYSLRDRL